MAIGSVNISVKGDRQFVNAVAQLAFEEGKTTAEFVRAALDTLYGDDINEILRFAEQRAARKSGQGSGENLFASPVPRKGQ
jgi:hypothetical protein